MVRLMDLTKVDSALIARMVDGAMWMNMLATKETNTTGNFSPLRRVKISPVFAMEEQISLVLVDHVRMVRLSVMLIKMPTVQIAYNTMARLCQKMPVEVKETKLKLLV